MIHFIQTISSLGVCVPLPKAPAILGDMSLHDKNSKKKRATTATKQKASQNTEPASVAHANMGADIDMPMAVQTASLPPKLDAPAKSSSTHVKRPVVPSASTLLPAMTEAVAPQPVTKPEDKTKITTTTIDKKTAETKASQRSIRVTQENERRLFVLDTNVLLHDPSSIFRFEEHDIYLSLVVLEELDNNKKGLSEVARNARTVSRMLDQLLSQKTLDVALSIQQGIALSALGNTEAQGRVFFQTTDLDVPKVEGFVQFKADNYILGVAQALQKLHPQRQVVLVSKDINMRIKAHTLNILSEDYYNDHVIDDTDLLYPGYLALPENFWPKHSKGMESWQNPKTGETFYKIQGPIIPQLLINQFLYFDPQDGSLPFYAQVVELHPKHAVLKTITDYTHQKNKVWGITARNKEQNFAINLLMNADIDFVSLLGPAGTGKTLLTLATALTMVIEQKRYNEIIVTRATVPLGEDIGFLPGTEEEKMQPWMGALDDNLEVLQGDSGAGEWGRGANLDFIRSKIKIKSMSFMRGRTFVNKLVMIDEAQNLTPKQMKALITRAGPGSKIICMGNIAQIDTPYLTEGSSGLTYVVDRFKQWAHSGHVTLARGERSRLADFANDVL